MPEVTALRHDFHQHPELRFHERWTSERIARFLDENRVPYRRGYAKGTGIVAALEGRKGKTVALRADMDGLEIMEATGLSYASLASGRMHACGHDGHMACLCGVAKALSLHRGALAGTVKFIFQPAEELAGGGRLMVEEGVLDDVDAVFALHGWPGLPVGSIGIRPGWMMAGADFFKIVVHGKGCHGADPASGVDPVVVAAHIITALQTIVSRERDPREPAVVTVARIEAGTESNIIPEQAMLVGTIRGFRPEVCDALRVGVARIAQQTAQAFRASAAVEFGQHPYPALYNDPTMTQLVRNIAARTLGDTHVAMLDMPSMMSEDFAFYLQKAPGVFIYLGLNANPPASYAPLHNPQFDFNDDALPTGMTLLTHLALQVLS